MIHLLLITSSTEVARQGEALLSSPKFHLQHRRTWMEAQALVEAGLFEVILFAPGASPAEIDDFFGKAGVSATSTPIVFLAPEELAPGVEQRAYAAGAAAVLRRPWERASLESVLVRLGNRTAARSPVLASVQTPRSESETAALGSRPLEVMRDLSQILGYSLDWQECVRQFVLKLRDILHVNRVVIFLASPASRGASETGGRLPVAASVGVPASLLTCFELTGSSGIGGFVTSRGQILRREASGEPEKETRASKEFSLLGCEVALPVSDRERCLGVALLGGRLTGAALSDGELELVCHLLEELGVAVKNSWLHDELEASHRLTSEVLGSLTQGCLVMGSDFTLLHCNRAARELLGLPTGEGDFAQLPADLAGPLNDLITHHQPREPFFLETPARPGRPLRVTLLPLVASAESPRGAIVVLEDFTQIEANQRSAVELANNKLVALFARRFAHEIRNSLVPLTTHEQLFDSEYESGDFRQSLKTALSRETSRIQRFTEQMLLLSQNRPDMADFAPIDAVLHEAFDLAQKLSDRPGELRFTPLDHDLLVRHNHTSLVHAFQELFLNALQSGGPSPQVEVVVAEVPADGRPTGIEIALRDSGRGFSPEALARALEPFYTTRNTGVGLGLTVARKILQDHGGRLELRARLAPSSADISIYLPLAS